VAGRNREGVVVQNQTRYVKVQTEADVIQQLSIDVLFRIARGDFKGRPFGTPRNPRMPTVEEFNPHIGEVRVGDLKELIVRRRHGIFPEQAQRLSQMSNEDLIRLRLEDPISATEVAHGFSLTGGHHRTDEIMKRVQAGQLDPETIIRILIHA
jgi:hypothetical protein